MPAIPLVGGQSVAVNRAITINRPPEEVYQFWRRLENLPRFMKHLDTVSQLDERRSHWVARAPLGLAVSWDAEIVAEQENERLSWRSIGETVVHNSGSVRFA